MTGRSNEQPLRAVLDLEAFEAGVAELSGSYRTARPFAHVVLDDFLRPEVFEAACREFPEPGHETWTSYMHFNERKHGNMAADRWPPTVRAVAQALTSDRFVAAIGRLTGIEGLLSDWSMDGGGLHQSTAGGFLNVHADFTSHHKQENWRRRVNLLLYLNETWSAEWGGGLELWDREMRGSQATIEPIGNRVVVFTTDETSFHGHPEPMTCPRDVDRRSMALYYFTDEGTRALAKYTDYRARPGDGLKSVGIYLDKQVLHVYDVVKRRLQFSDDVGHAVLSRLERLGRRRRRE